MAVDIGKPLFFDPEIFCSVVEQMIMSDEVERALLMLDNVPAYYRDNPTPRMKEIRESLHRQLFTPAQYSGADAEGADLDQKSLESIFPHRAHVLGERVKAYNEQGIKPNLMEIGPGTYFLPYALRARGLEFTYESQSLAPRDLPFDRPKDPSINIFIAFELIEHLSNEAEIFQAYLKFGKEASDIFISTPLYTYGGGIVNWRANALGHLRSYTPEDLAKFCQKYFKGYTWQVYLSDTITIHGGKQ